MDFHITGPVKMRGEICVPGDKSISHRAAILGTLAEGITEIGGFSPGEDCLSTLRCLEALGAKVENSNSDLKIYGLGLRGLQEPQDVLQAGNSGTTMRILLGALAGQEGYFTLTGDASLRKRPMARVVEPLRKMGAFIFGRQGGRFAPLTVVGRPLKALNYTLPVASAQVKSAIILAALFTDGVTSITEPFLSRDHTERMLRSFGGKIKKKGLEVVVSGNNRLKGQKLFIPGDISAAAFFLVAACIVPGAEILIKNVGINPTRTGIIEIMRKMEADVRIINQKMIAGEPVADLLVRASKLKGTCIKGGIIPRLIDEIPVLAVAATQAHGETLIKDAQELRVKESDRISLTVKELKCMGAQVKELPDGMIIKGPVRLRAAEVNAHGDHRLAMSLAVAGLVAEGETVVREAESAGISYPGFFEHLKSLLED